MYICIYVVYIYEPVGVEEVVLDVVLFWMEGEALEGFGRRSGVCVDDAVDVDGLELFLEEVRLVGFGRVE